MAHKEYKIISDSKDSFVNEMIKKEDIKKTLRSCWQKVLEIENISFNDNFYELGGTSSNILQVQQAINSALEIDIKVVDLFMHPTIEELASYISDIPVTFQEACFRIWKLSLI